MQPVHRSFDDFGSIVDDVHALFAGIEEREEQHLPLDYFAVQVLKLAVHEWIANLVQHADFSRAAPRVRLLLIPEKGRVRCMIEDNSNGFDLISQSVYQQHQLQGSVHPPDRGRGLLMMIACTENISYGAAPSGEAGGDGFSGSGWFRLEFWISPYTRLDGSLDSRASRVLEETEEWDRNTPSPAAPHFYGKVD